MDCSVLGLAVGLFAQPAVSQNQNQNIEPRIAFVVGNSAYERRPIENALNDAGLVAEALRSIGFDIVEGADLGQQDFLRSFGEFLGKVEAAGPEAIAFVYFSGYGVAFEGENFLVPVDARLERDSDIPLRALRLSDLMRSLAASPARAKVFAIDAARPLPFNFRDAPLAIGLAALEAPQGVLVGFSAGPGTVAQDPPPPSYGTFATALAEMLRTPGLDLDALFVRVRTRVHQLTEGRQTPWHVTGLAEPVVLVADDVRTDATVSAPPPPPRFEREVRPMREIGPDESYAMAIELDTLDGYTEFVESYPRHAYAGRIYAIIRARREALAWLRARQINTPESYWTYLMRYPDGLYAFDARRRLRRLSAAFAPPPGFAPVEFYDVPPPLAGEPVEYIYIERYAGPPPPRILIAPPPAFFHRLAAPRVAPAPPGASFRALPQTVSIPVIQQVSPARRPDFQQRRQERLQQQQQTTTTSPSAPRQHRPQPTTPPRHRPQRLQRASRPCSPVCRIRAAVRAGRRCRQVRRQRSRAPRLPRPRRRPVVRPATPPAASAPTTTPPPAAASADNNPAAATTARSETGPASVDRDSVDRNAVADRSAASAAAARERDGAEHHTRRRQRRHCRRLRRHRRLTRAARLDCRGRLQARRLRRQRRLRLLRPRPSIRAACRRPNSGACRNRPRLLRRRPSRAAARRRRLRPPRRLGLRLHRRPGSAASTAATLRQAAAAAAAPAGRRRHPRRPPRRLPPQRPAPPPPPAARPTPPPPPPAARAAPPPPPPPRRQAGPGTAPAAAPAKKCAVKDGKEVCQ